jgi:hypothetical protein
MFGCKNTMPLFLYLQVSWSCKNLYSIRYLYLHTPSSAAPLSEEGGIEPWTVTYLYAEGAAQHGGARRAGDNAASSVEVLRPEDDHCRVPDTVQRAS